MPHSTRQFMHLWFTQLAFCCLLLSSVTLLVSSCSQETKAHSARSLAPVTIHMIGDSTMADKPLPNDQNERGWGQMLPGLVKDEARIMNYAKNGRSSKSFIDEGLWAAALDNMKTGDWLIIQFGHNDQKNDEARHTDPFAGYTENLKMFVSVAREKGVNPILCTSIVRGSNLDSHGVYPKAVIAVAETMNVPLHDLEKATKSFVAALGESRQKEFYIKKDSTHLNVEGGLVVAAMAAKELKQLNLPISDYIL